MCGCLAHSSRDVRYSSGISILTEAKRIMDSAFAALAGSVIGGLTSLAASWLTQRVQLRAQQIAQDVSRREELYKNFIEEASKLVADAYEHDQASISNLVSVYALDNRMRVLSSPRIIENADRVIQAIIDRYLEPNKTLRDVREILGHDAMNPMREFSNACREELQALGSR
jgi:hypothetical protein